MQKVKQKLENLQKMQIKVNYKLDLLEKRHEKFDDTEMSREKLRKDLENLFRENKNKTEYRSSLEVKEIDKNYLDRDNFIEKSKNNSRIINKSNQKSKNKTSQIVKHFDKSVESEKIMPPIPIQQNTNIKVESIKPRPLQEINKSKFHMRQNLFLTNELVNLRVKLNNMQNKNSLLKNILNNTNEVKNFKLMEKLINGFIEGLAVNWNEIVEMIIDELIEDEVYKLNEIELKKIRKNEEYVKLAEEFQFSNQKEFLQGSTGDQPMHIDELKEINKLLSDFGEQEKILFNKYNLK